MSRVRNSAEQRLARRGGVYRRRWRVMTPPPLGKSGSSGVRRSCSSQRLSSFAVQRNATFFTPLATDADRGGRCQRQVADAHPGQLYAGPGIVLRTTRSRRPLHVFASGAASTASLREREIRSLEAFHWDRQNGLSMASAEGETDVVHEGTNRGKAGVATRMALWRSVSR